MSVRWIPAAGSAAAVNAALTPFQTAIPFVNPPSLTMGNNGAISALATVLATTYADCYMWFATNVISAATPAGWYYTQMSSNTAGTVFNNAYTTGVPVIPTAPTAFVTTGTGATTGVTGALTGLQFVLPANSMGKNGRLFLGELGSNPNSAGTKNFLASLGGSTAYNPQATTNTAMYLYHEIFNRGKTNVQVNTAAGQAGPGGFVTAPNYAMAVDTTTALTVQFNLNMNTATDWQVIEEAWIQLFPSG